MAKKVRRFNDEGNAYFRSVISDFRNKAAIDHDNLKMLTEDDRRTEIVDGLGELEYLDGKSKIEVARSLYKTLSLDTNRHFNLDSGIWNWLSAVLLPSLVKYDSTGKPQFSDDDALYVYDSSWKRYYRHLVAFPCLVYTDLQEKGLIFLRGQIYERGEIVEQLASMQEVQRNPGVIEAATILYFDYSKNDVVRGAASKPNERRKIGGQARRLREVLGQFALTYDLNAMTGEEIVSILPKEFDRWKTRRAN